MIKSREMTVGNKGPGTLFIVAIFSNSFCGVVLGTWILLSEMELKEVAHGKGAA